MRLTGNKRQTALSAAAVTGKHIMRLEFDLTAAHPYNVCTL